MKALRGLVVGTVGTLALGACTLTGSESGPDGLGEPSVVEAVEGSGDSGEGSSDELPVTLSGEGAEAGACDPHKATLFAAQHTTAGRVTVVSTEDNLVVSVTGNEPWMFKAVHIYVGPGPVPTWATGVAAPGLFPFSEDFAFPVPSYTRTIPLSALGSVCNDSLTIAVHANAVKMVEGHIVERETAWAYGEHELPNGWGWSFDYPVCCGTHDDSCTWTQGYWKTHHATARNKRQRRPWPIAEATPLCGSSWLDILQTPAAGGDAWMILAHQWIAMMLNVTSGASSTREVEAVRARAKELLEPCTVDDEHRDEALAIAATFDAYNNGVIGPGHCGE